MGQKIKPFVRSMRDWIGLAGEDERASGRHTKRTPVADIIVRATAISKEVNETRPAVCPTGFQQSSGKRKVNGGS